MTSTNFFDAGGDSITAIRLVSRIREEFPDSCLTVRDILENPTIDQMMERVVERSGGIVVDVEISKLARSLTIRSGSNDNEEPDRVSFLTQLRRSRSRQTVICFPGFGWLGGEFAEFIEHSEGYGILLANNPRGNHDMNWLVTSIGDEIARRVDERLIFLGHSLGGLIACRVAEYLKPKECAPFHVVMIDSHQADSQQHSEGIDTSFMVERLLGSNGKVPSAARRRFERNASIMNSWIAQRKLETWCEGATSIEAGDSNAEARRIKVAPESTFKVPGADHFSILKWPHVFQIVAVVEILFDEEKDE